MWNYRLGYTFFQSTNKIQMHCPFVNVMTHLGCYICPKAKEKRNVFPNHINSSKRPFELIHIDVWGPYSIDAIENFCYL